MPSTGQNLAFVRQSNRDPMYLIDLHDNSVIYSFELPDLTWVNFVKVQHNRHGREQPREDPLQFLIHRKTAFFHLSIQALSPSSFVCQRSPIISADTKSFGEVHNCFYDAQRQGLVFIAKLERNCLQRCTVSNKGK